jgi:uncharacterized protein
MIALDTNVLVYAHRADSQWHAAARRAVTTLAEGRGQWAIPWPCIHEFLAVVTHSRFYAPPTPLDRAVDQVEAWMAMPNLILLGEPHGYWESLRAILIAGRIGGPQMHDARVAALCASHGVSEIWSADRDFSRFAELKVRNPLLG